MSSRNEINLFLLMFAWFRTFLLWVVTFVLRLLRNNNVSFPSFVTQHMHQSSHPTAWKLAVKHHLHAISPVQIQNHCVPRFQNVVLSLIIHCFVSVWRAAYASEQSCSLSLTKTAVIATVFLFWEKPGLHFFIDTAASFTCDCVQLVITLLSYLMS